MLFSAVMGGFAYSMMREVGTPTAADGNAPPGFGLMYLMFENFSVLLVVQCVVAVVAIWAGIDLLRLKAWARLAIEVLCWLAVLWTVGFGIYWIHMWISMTGQAPISAGPAGSHAFQVMGVVMDVVATLVFAIPLGIMIRYLRSREARSAFDGRAVYS